MVLVNSNKNNVESPNPRAKSNIKNNRENVRRPKSVAGIITSDSVSLTYNDDQQSYNYDEFSDGRRSGFDSVGEPEDGPASDAAIVPRRGPRPPARRRPKSTPVINITQLMADKKR